MIWPEMEKRKKIAKPRKKAQTCLRCLHIFPYLNMAKPSDKFQDFKFTVSASSPTHVVVFTRGLGLTDKVSANCPLYDSWILNIVQVLCKARAVLSVLAV